MSITAIVAALVKSGATPEMILAAVAADEISRLEGEALKREATRQRVRKHREKCKENNEPVTDVTVTRVTNVTSSSPLIPPSQVSPTPPSNSPPYNPPISEKKPIGQKKKIPHRLNEDWDLPQDWGEWCEQYGLSEAEINLQADKFKDYWVGNGKAKADWQATWRNWIRTHLERNQNGIRKEIRRNVTVI